MNRMSRRLLGVMAGVCVATTPVVAQPSEMAVKAGFAVRAGMTLDLNGGSYSQAQGVLERLRRLNDPAAAGPAKAYADRTYADGFVNRDVGTGTAATLEPNTTWFWGYENADQVSGDELFFLSSRYGTTVRTSEATSRAAHDKERFAAPGIALAVDVPLLDLKQKRMLEGIVGLRFFQNRDVNLHARPVEATVTRSRYRVRDAYDVSDISMPSAPYAGSYLGPFDNPPVIPSPVIANLPDRRERHYLDPEATWTARSDVDLDVETSLLEFRIGPAFRMETGNGSRIRIQPAVSLNYLHLDLEREEAFRALYADGTREVLGSWRDENSQSGWRWGAGVETTVEIPVRDQWSLEISLAADWVETLDAPIGPNRVSADVSGYTAAVMFVKTLGGPPPGAAVPENTP